MRTGRALNQPMKENPFLVEQRRPIPRNSFLAGTINSFSGMKKLNTLPPIIQKPKLSDANVVAFAETKTPVDERSEEKEASSRDQEKSG